MMQKPKRLFRRDRRLLAEPNDRRRVDYTGPPTEPIPQPELGDVLDLSKHVVLVPVHRSIETDTYHCLRGLEDLGVRVDYSKGSSAIDCTRNVLASDAIREGMESILFIDADMLFDPADAVRLLLRPEPVVAGAYAAKRLLNGQINASFPADMTDVLLGKGSNPSTPVDRVGAGFMRIKIDAMKTIIQKLGLPFCRMAHTFGWPLFQPLIDDDPEDGLIYYPEDYAFCTRCKRAGVPVVLDTTFRLYHLGEYAYGWEEATGEYLKRYSTVKATLTRNKPPRPPLPVL